MRPCRLTTIHGQLSTTPVGSVPDARFRVVPHMYSTVSVFTTPGAGSPHQPLLTDTRQRGRKPPHAALAFFMTSGPAVQVRPGTPYSASTISMDPLDARCRIVQSNSIPPTNATATMTNVRRLGLMPSYFSWAMCFGLATTPDPPRPTADVSSISPIFDGFRVVLNLAPAVSPWFTCSRLSHPRATAFSPTLAE